MVPGHGDGIWGSLFRTATLTWAKVMGGMTRTKPVRANSCVIQSAAIDAFALVQGGTPVTFGSVASRRFRTAVSSGLDQGVRWNSTRFSPTQALEPRRSPR